VRASKRPAFFRFGPSTVFTGLALAGLPTFITIETFFPRPSNSVGEVGLAILFSPIVSAPLGLVLAAGYGLRFRRWQYAVECIICAAILVFYGLFHLFPPYFY
jgi:hypothetical protein